MLKIILWLITFGLVLWFLWRLLSKRYALPCPTWLSWMVEMDNPFTKTNRATTIIEHLNLKPSMCVLDIGCGPGRLTIPLSPMVGPNGTVVAMDMQLGMLDITKNKALTANLTNIQFLHAAIGSNKLEQNKFDRILLVTVLGEIPNQIAALQEIHKALKPDGILSITEIIFDPHFQRRSKVTKLAKSLGFEEDSFFGNSIAYTLHLKKHMTLINCKEVTQ